MYAIVDVSCNYVNKDKQWLKHSAITFKYLTNKELRLYEVALWILLKFLGFPLKLIQIHKGS